MRDLERYGSISDLGTKFRNLTYISHLLVHLTYIFCNFVEQSILRKTMLLP